MRVRDYLNAAIYSAKERDYVRTRFMADIIEEEGIERVIAESGRCSGMANEYAVN